jgi:hypothetical protein
MLELELAIRVSLMILKWIMLYDNVFTGLMAQGRSVLTLMEDVTGGACWFKLWWTNIMIILGLAL